MEPTVKDVLNKAIDYMKSGWTTGASARDANGFRVAVNSDSAVCWCAAGAIEKSIYSLFSKRFSSDHNSLFVGADQAVRRVCTTLYKKDYVDFNDEQTSVEPVIDLFRSAADHAEQDI